MEQQNKLLRISEKLNDALSLIIILENDMSVQKSDDVYLRIMKILHNIINSAQKEI